MSSCNPTGPINIIHTNKNCFNKCKFSYNFKKSEVSVVNKNTYLSIRLNDKDNVSAKFSSTNTPNCKNGGESDLTIDEVRIYSPSIHTYSNKKERADAEVIIILSNVTGGRHLIVSLPITSQNGNMPIASGQLTNIISYMSSSANSQGEGGQIRGLNFDLNSFIPQGKGYYSYAASLPWDACDKCTDYIVYDRKDVIISLNNFVLSKLQKMLEQDNNIKLTKSDYSDLGYAYNKRGAIPNLDNNDTIWINCYPTGAEGQILVEQSKSGILNNNAFGIFTGMDIKTFDKYMLFIKIFICTVLCVALLYVIIFILPGFILGKINPKAKPPAS
tara:strand:+ start:1384 stop:2373 length:990 start_codon:yes stop_codon:yes gene_type:complete